MIGEKWKRITIKKGFKSTFGNDERGDESEESWWGRDSWERVSARER